METRLSTKALLILLSVGTLFMADALRPVKGQAANDLQITQRNPTNGGTLPRLMPVTTTSGKYQFVVYDSTTQRPFMLTMGSDFGVAGGELETNLAMVSYTGSYNDLSDKPTLTTGPQGPVGGDGKSAYQVAVDNGFVGTQSQWLDSLVGEQGETGETGPKGGPGDSITGPAGPSGAVGKSAYEVAVQNGYVGSESAWLASLVGATGATGGVGPKGDTGDIGPASTVPGPTGPAGPASTVPGPTGATGSPGTAATVAVGTVTTGAAGSSATVTNGGTTSAAVLNFTIPRGNTGANGTVSYGAPSSRTVALATAYQCTDTTKPCILTLTLQANSSISLSGTSNNEGNIVIGSTNAVTSGTGTAVATYRNQLGGTLVIGLNITSNQSNTYSVFLPAGWYFAVRQTSGTGLQVVSAFEQLAGS